MKKEPEVKEDEKMEYVYFDAPLHLDFAAGGGPDTFVLERKIKVPVDTKILDFIIETIQYHTKKFNFKPFSMGVSPLAFLCVANILMKGVVKFDGQPELVVMDVKVHPSVSSDKWHFCPDTMDKLLLYAYHQQTILEKNRKAAEQQKEMFDGIAKSLGIKLPDPESCDCPDCVARKSKDKSGGTGIQ